MYLLPGAIAAGGHGQLDKAKVHAAAGGHLPFQNGGEPDELRHGAAVRHVVDFLGRGDLQQPPFLEHRHPVGHGQRLFLVVGDQQGGGTKLLLQCTDLVAQMAPHAGIQRGQRLVQQQRTRIDGQRARQRHALLLPAGELLHTALREIGQAHHLQELCRPGMALCGWHLAQRQPVGHVVPHRQVRKQRIALEHHANTALVHRRARHVLASQCDAALVAGLQPRNQLEQGGLARAAGADHRHQLALANVEGHLVQPLLAAGVAVTDVLESQAHGDLRKREEDRSAARLASSSRITVAAQAKPVAP